MRNTNYLNALLTHYVTPKMLQVNIKAKEKKIKVM